MWIGSRDWVHQHWQESFYPDTLPDDWWLTYYSNEFRCVLVPAERLGPDTAADWSADTHQRFRFFLQLDSANDWAANDWATWAARAAALGSRLGGFVCPAEAAPATHEPALQQLIALAVPLSVDAAEHPWIEAGVARPLWRPEREVSGCSLGLVQVDAATDRRTLRRHIEAFGRQAALGAGESALFLAGPELRPETLRDAVVIAGLLGL